MNAMRWIFAAQGLVVMVPIALAAIGAQSTQPTPFTQSTPSTPGTPATPAVPFPHDYRAWQHVKSIVIGPEHKSFELRGGIHHYYANKKAVEGYRTGRFPNGSVIVDEAVWTQDATGQGKGIVLEGRSRFLDVMVKNDRLYKDTGGWGFEHFEGEKPTGVLDVDRRTRCYECHAKRQDRDHVYSAIRVTKFGASGEDD
jgi:hypothetical protein